MDEYIRTILLIVACFPPLYWISKITIAMILYKFSSPHNVTLELEDGDGNILKSIVVDVSKDRRFYSAVDKANKMKHIKQEKAK